MDEVEAKTILKRDALGRVTVSKEQRESMLDAFERSGLKGTQFARLAGVNYQTFACWMQARRHARDEYAPHRAVSAKPQATAVPLRLMEAVVAASAVVPASGSESSALSSSALELLLPGGAKMRIADAAQVALAAQLLNALRTPC